MEVKLENGEVLKAEWIEVWREDNSILVGTKDDVLKCSLEDRDTINNAETKTTITPPSGGDKGENYNEQATSI